MRDRGGPRALRGHYRRPLPGDLSRLWQGHGRRHRPPRGLAGQGCPSLVRCRPGVRLLGGALRGRACRLRVCQGPDAHRQGVSRQAGRARPPARLPHRDSPPALAAAVPRALAGQEAEPPLRAPAQGAPGCLCPPARARYPLRCRGRPRGEWRAGREQPAADGVRQGARARVLLACRTHAQEQRRKGPQEARSRSRRAEMEDEGRRARPHRATATPSTWRAATPRRCATWPSAWARSWGRSARR